MDVNAVPTISPTLSIVVPVFNEERNLQPLYEKLTGIIEPINVSYEVIVSDNCSTDETATIAKALVSQDKRWRYLRLSRNFGYQINLSAGLSYARGEAVVILDADMQDPPEMIPQFLDLWRQGYDVVFGIRKERLGEALWRRTSVRLFYRLINAMSPLAIPIDAGDFRLINRRVQRELLRHSESDRYLRGLFAHIGFRQIGIPYERQPRRRGKSKFAPLGLVSLGLDGLLSFSMMPLRALTVFGLLVLIGDLAYAAFTVYQWGTRQAPQGWTSLAILLLALSGIQILFLGLIGEYVGRTYIEAKKRPLWFVDEEVNIEDPNRSQLMNRG